MGARGRLPKSAKLKKLAGNPGRRKPKEVEPINAVEPPMPDVLKGIAAAKWREHMPELVKRRRITTLDADVFATYCLIWETVVETADQLRKEGRTQLSEKGFICNHPAIGIHRAARQDLIAYAARLGLDPKSDQQIPKRPDEKDKADDPLAALMRTSDD